MALISFYLTSKGVHAWFFSQIVQSQAQMHTWKETKALYRLLDEPDVTCAALMQPHVQQTREQALSSRVVLLVQETR